MATVHCRFMPDALNTGPSIHHPLAGEKMEMNVAWKRKAVCVLVCVWRGTGRSPDAVLAAFVYNSKVVIV